MREKALGDSGRRAAGDGGKEEGDGRGEGKVEEGKETLLDGDGRRGVDGAECGEFDRVGGANRGEVRMGVATDDTKTVAERVVRVGDKEGFRGWVRRVKCERGKGRGLEVLGCGEIGSGCCVEG